MLRAYTRTIKRWPVSKQDALLKAAGVNMKAVYRDGEWSKAVKSLLPGDKLVVGGGLRVIGDNRKEIVAAIEQVRERGATVIDAETKREAGGDDGVALLDEALRKIQGGATIQSLEVAAEMQKKSVASRTKGRMGDREAQAIWSDVNLTINDCLELMTGWSQGTAYRTFGPRHVGFGRPPVASNPNTLNVNEPDAPNKKPQIYFIQAGNQVKIGFSTTPEKRYSALQTSHHRKLKMLAVIDGTQEEEKMFHRLFAEYRLNGEWFKYSDEIKEYIAKATEGKAMPKASPPRRAKPKRSK